MTLEFVATGALFALSSGVACIIGGKPERAAGILLLSWIGLDRLYHAIIRSDSFASLDLASFAFDFIVFGCLVAIALRANRIWPVVAASLQSVVVLGHLSAIPNVGMQRAYWTMTQIPPLFVALTVLVGTLAHVLRVRRVGPYPGWRPSTPR